MNDPWSVAGKIVETIDSLHGVAALREEVARLKAINAKLEGVSTTKTVEISNLRKTKKKLSDDLDQARKEAVRLKEIKAANEREIARKGTTIVGLRTEIGDWKAKYQELADAADELTPDGGNTVVTLEEIIERKDEAMEKISASNAELRKVLADVQSARDGYRQDAIELRDVVNDVRRTIDAFDEED